MPIPSYQLCIASNPKSETLIETTKQIQVVTPLVFILGPLAGYTGKYKWCHRLNKPHRHTDLRSLLGSSEKIFEHGLMLNSQCSQHLSYHANNVNGATN